MNTKEFQKIINLTSNVVHLQLKNQNYISTPITTYMSRKSGPQDGGKTTLKPFFVGADRTRPPPTSHVNLFSFHCGNCQQSGQYFTGQGSIFALVLYILTRCQVDAPVTIYQTLAANTPYWLLENRISHGKYLERQFHWQMKVVSGVNR